MDLHLALQRMDTHLELARAAAADRGLAQGPTYPPPAPTTDQDDPPRTCADWRHCWPADYVWGDTCACGKFTMLTDERGLIWIEFEIEGSP